ncbi:Signal transducer regulating beta-lactamase production, contains metallopeptidase domain [Chryseolinea serpens]|uniref:Signal transducer regulating beta-lactamase production, contains metallopeptidase domain n=1 Tax=Chryseolinea serpens TaxID=947013 RepID=A0A1M5NBR5_9BACT|nr:M56 family metallopeptidase [Chryseolinea serpens]SHG86892.1 Signal transducer regulating beta-lactamase production, contains metallopeptidase domain [Chryseolinea serpens]
MNTLLHFFDGAWAQALGFTVIHSLWQALLIGMLVVGVLRCVPSRRSGLRYALAGAGLLLIFLASASTFLWLLPSGGSQIKDAAISFTGGMDLSSTSPEALSLRQLLTRAYDFLHGIVPFVVLAWSLGTALFILRLFGGWWYTTKLKQQAVLLDTPWTERMETLLRQFNIDRAVRLAESAMVQAPVVIGYLKPIILLPVGMCAGLSTTQLESILIHELIHIRRHDYLVNLLQSVVEALFFFNPFVWMISGILRQEREHCCDDAVVLHQGNALAYAHALATLEEVRLSKAGVALSLAENKNQLLNRIKRLMEKSVKNYSPRERIIPVLLLVVGLMCASWLTVQSRNTNPASQANPDNQEKPVAADTTKKNKSAKYEMRKITTTNEDGKPGEVKVIETYDGDEDMREIMHRDMDMDFDHDFDVDIDMPDFDFEIPPIPPIPAFDFNVEPVEPVEPVGPVEIHIPDLDIQFKFDGISTNIQENAAFSQQIEAFAERQAEMAERHAEMAQAQAERHAERAREMAERSAQIAAFQGDKARAHEQSWKGFEEKMKKFESDMTEWEAVNAPKMKAMEDQAKAMEKKMHGLDKELKSQLVKDGYLAEGEKLTSIQITDDDRFLFNGKEIKASDREKYKAIFTKHSIGHIDRKKETAEMLGKDN